MGVIHTSANSHSVGKAGMQYHSYTHAAAHIMCLKTSTQPTKPPPQRNKPISILATKQHLAKQHHTPPHNSTTHGYHSVTATTRAAVHHGKRQTSQLASKQAGRQASKQATRTRELYATDHLARCQSCPGCVCRGAAQPTRLQQPLPDRMTSSRRGDPRPRVMASSR